MRHHRSPGIIGIMAVAMLLALSSPGLAAQDPRAAAFEALGGQAASLADYQGQVVVLNLWAVWCSPCLIEIPHLVALQKSLSEEEVTVIGLAVDSGNASAIRRFWERRLRIEPNYPLWVGTSEQALDLFDARTFPTTLIIDRHGDTQRVLVGLQTKADLKAAIAAVR